MLFEFPQSNFCLHATLEQGVVSIRVWYMVIGARFACAALTGVIAFAHRLDNYFKSCLNIAMLTLFGLAYAKVTD